MLHINLSGGLVCVECFTVRMYVRLYVVCRLATSNSMYIHTVHLIRKLIFHARRTGTGTGVHAGVDFSIL